MATEKFGNDFQTTAAEAIDSSETAIDMASAAPTELRSGQFRIRVDDEIMLVTSGQDTTTWTVIRGQEGTTAASHSNGAIVDHVFSVKGAQALAHGDWTPALQSQLAYTFDPYQSATNSNGSSQEVFYARTACPRPITITNITTYVHTVGATVTTWKLGVYDSSGALIAQTANQNAAALSSGYKTFALTAESGKSLIDLGGAHRDDWIWLAWIFVGTTSPKFMTPAGIDVTFVQSGISASPNYRSCKDVSLSALPASIGTPAVEGSGRLPWIGLT